jgi:hypothetical protein
MQAKSWRWCVLSVMKDSEGEQWVAHLGREGELRRLLLPGWPAPPRKHPALPRKHLGLGEQDQDRDQGRLGCFAAALAVDGAGLGGFKAVTAGETRKELQRV